MREIQLRFSRPRWRRRLFYAVILISVLMMFKEIAAQSSDNRYVASVAREVVKKAEASDNRSRVIALRDYLRAHVSFESAPMDDRPFLRASAAETLRSGQGYCGEVTRAFICMAESLGIRAQRINLYGQVPHVVAEAELAPGDLVIVDCQNPSQIEGLDKLDEVILRPEYDDYCTLNLHRLRLDWLVSRIKLEMGPLTYWVENPHALKAPLWFLLGAMLLISRGVMKGAGILMRAYLRRRGWIHPSEAKAIQALGITSSAPQ